jgi:hypothetical protein
MIRQPQRWLALAALAAALAIPKPANADVLYYGGNWDGSTMLLPNGNFFSDVYNVYDNFTVTGAGWGITQLFSNDFIEGLCCSSAHWEIRSGVSLFNGGTLIAEGDAIPSIAPTGRVLSGTPEYNVIVDIPKVVLPAGIYWLNVSPREASVTSAEYFATPTTGQDAIGVHLSPDEDFVSGTNGFNFVDTHVVSLIDTFSDGVAGSVCSEVVGNPRTGVICLGGLFAGNGAEQTAIRSLVTIPEPSSLLLLSSALFTVAAWRRRIRSS